MDIDRENFRRMNIVKSAILDMVLLDDFDRFVFESLHAELIETRRRYKAECAVINAVNEAAQAKENAARLARRQVAEAMTKKVLAESLGYDVLGVGYKKMTRDELIDEYARHGPSGEASK